MRAIKIKYKNSLLKRLFISFFILSLSALYVSKSAFAQAPDSITNVDSTTMQANTDTIAGPSLTNLSKTLGASEQERKKIEEERAAEERKALLIKIGIATIGTLVVAGFAWFLTSLSKKQQKKKDAIRAQRLEKLKEDQAKGYKSKRK